MTTAAGVPFRDTFWNVPGWAQILLYVGGFVAVAVFAWGVWRRVQLWRAGGPEHRLDRIPQRVKLVVTHALGQVRVLSQAYPGVMHATMLWGFLALFMGTVLATIDYDITLPLFDYKLLKGDFYLYYETVLDLFGLFFVIGRATHLGVWLFHAAISLLFIAIIPHSYFMHMLTTPLNIFFSKLGPRGVIPKIENIEAAESLGVSKLEEFSWKRRLDFDACVECGRCQAACPASMAGTALSPKQIIVKLKRHMHGELPGPIHGELIKADELWACTTCMACVQECPAFIDIVDTIIDLRRYLALSEGALPSTAPQSLQNIQRAGNPWGLPAGERLAWAHGLDVPVLEPGKEVEYLYWVGCSASYDRRNQAIARSVVAILKKAGVSYAVMQEERCHGEVARRLGDEYLYQTLQAENVEALKQYSFRKVITHCPHCFNTIKNEFPQFGGTFEVLHHSQLIDELVQSGRLKPRKQVAAAVAFHDSCYLGRYNGMFEAPRRALSAVPGLRVVEPPRARERGLCCGGGGGHMWMEVKSEKRVNIIRTEELLATGVGVVATACPFCLAMVDLGRKVKEAEERLTVKDVSELVAESLE